MQRFERIPHETVSVQHVKKGSAGGVVSDMPSTALALARKPSPAVDAMLRDAAKTLGVSVPIVQAVAAVESRGKGFLKSGRPTIRFERHIFYRRLAAHGLEPACFAKHSPGIIARRAGGNRGGELEQLRLKQASAIHTSAAHESASWEAFQIMGYHWRVMGYTSVQGFAADMHKSYAHQLRAFVRFISADSGLRSALRRKDWTDFARRHNGPGYAKNGYDVKLAVAYERLMRYHEKPHTSMASCFP
jgi:hypothetical protein